MLHMKILLFFIVFAVCLMILMIVFMKRKWKIIHKTMIDNSLPKGFETISLAVIHHFSSGVLTQKLQNMMKDNIVIVLGDVVSKNTSAARVKKNLSFYQSISAKYMIFSNSENDWGKKEIDSILLDSQFTLLQNDRVFFYSDKDESRLALIGIDEGEKGKTQYHYAFDDIKKDDYVIACSYEHPKELVEDNRFHINLLISESHDVIKTILIKKDKILPKKNAVNWLMRPELQVITIKRGEE